MKKNTLIHYRWSDTRVFLAISCACQAGRATLTDIISFGDAIHHVIFSPEELESGFVRLTAGGFIWEDKGIFKLTIRGLRLANRVSQAGPQTAAIQSELERLLSTSRPPYEGLEDHQNTLHYAGFSRLEYDTAVLHYRNSWSQSHANVTS